MNSRAARQLHDSPHLGVFYATGGGVNLLQELLSEPGASATVLDAQIPYAEQALAQVLGGAPDQACSEPTARALAMAAWQRARALSAGADDAVRNNLFGFGCTAALATNRPKRGAHRAHLAIQTLTTTASLSATFDKGTNGMGDRQAEESQITALAWQLMSSVLGVQLDRSPKHSGTEISERSASARPEWRRLLSGESHFEAHGETSPAEPPTLLLSGSFNPLHRGHQAMAAHAAERFGTPAAFELCIDNVDKPALGYAELEHRTAQFDDHRLWLTRLPTFIEKARHFPGCRFIVGIDTLVRIGEPRYYRDESAMFDALAEFAALNSGFVVFGRVHGAEFKTLSNSSVPSQLRELCVEIDEVEFRIDVSSSELREQRLATIDDS